MNIDDYREMLEPALERGGYTHCWNDVCYMVSKEKAQLWAGPDAAAITEIVETPQKRFLHVFLAGGNMDTIVDMLDSAKAWGRSMKCEAVTISGRKGWERVLEKHGFKPRLVTLEGRIEE